MFLWSTADTLCTVLAEYMSYTNYKVCVRLKLTEGEGKPCRWAVAHGTSSVLSGVPMVKPCSLIN